MSIKADRWIRKMALEEGMIEPFVEQQVREGIISYGLSSYGYDMRVAEEFKVFTNVFNVLVDPKNFSPRSFVDISADYCDIPPNSFALARSVEKFRIPRQVSCIVLGKSSYARCFSADTRVALVDGTAPTLEEMARRAESGESFWGYSIGQYSRLIVTMLEAPRYIGRDTLIEVALDNGECICCTPDHQFMRSDGRMVAAYELRPNDSLMPLYREVARGYEMVYQPLSGYLYPTHRLADEWNIANTIYVDEPGTHRHHIDHNRRNNNPWNIIRMDASGERRDKQSGIGRQSNIREEITAQAAREALDQTGSVRGTKWKNHKVVGLRDIKGMHDVYCLTVPEAGNFALEAGVFVHNCGIIINVTPLEPEWHGYVTIEISNTTPLPARIYANEGIGQVIFLESDEVCETSYADKKGKYQEQVGIVLPRIDTRD
jgi:dCTP deaminase